MMSLRKKQDVHISRRRVISSLLPALLLGIVLLSFLATPFSAYAAITMKDKETDLLWQAKSNYFYDALSHCAWNVANMPGLTGEGAKAQEKLGRLLDNIENKV